MRCNWKHRVFWEAWERAGGCSEISKLPISNPTPMNFAHILPKGQYPQHCYDLDNIVVLTTHEHTLLDHGTQMQREVYNQTLGGRVNWELIDEKKRIMHEKEIQETP